MAASTGNTEALAQIHQALSAWALVEQGHALSGERKFAEAEGKCREALAIRRKLLGNQHVEVAKALHALALVLEAQGERMSAESALREALAMPRELFGNQPQVVAEILGTLASVLRHQDKLVEADALYRDFSKDFGIDALNALAWRLATSTDPAFRDGMHAVLLGERAVELANRKDPNVLDTLAAAYAEAGQFEKAIAVEKEAVSLLEKDESMSKEGIISRLRLYESSTPYRADP